VSTATEQLERAIEAARRAVELDAGSTVAWHDLGVLYQRRGALTESRIAFERAIALDPSVASAHNNLGNTFTLLGERELAVESYRRAIELEPTLFPAHANAAAALYMLGRHDDARAHARRAVEIDPASTPARVTAAFVEGAISGYGAALVEIDALLARVPDDLTALAARAYILLRLERFDESARDGPARPRAPAQLWVTAGIARLRATRSGTLRGSICRVRSRVRARTRPRRHSGPEGGRAAGNR